MVELNSTSFFKFLSIKKFTSLILILEMELYYLKSTGVIRRIDELGRIVIPKEIRRNLGIRDGENVEIYTEADSIILKKHYRLQASSELANSLCEIIYNDMNYKIIITDREKIIASQGLNVEIISKELSPEYQNMIENREIITKENYTFKVEDIEITGNFIFIPIISLNDSIGLVIMYNPENFTGELSVGKLASSIFSRKLDI